MATRQFADLSSYRKAVNNAQATGNLLDTILGGIQQGVKLQQLPQTIQENQIAQQLQNAINQQKLIDLQNPEAAMARKLRNFAQTTALNQAITNPNSGIIQTPAGLEGETIFTPSALTPQQMASIPTDETLEMRRLASEIGGVNIASEPLPSAAPGLPITPIGVGNIQSGLSIDQNIPRQAAEDKLARDISLANSRVRSSGVQGQFIPDGFGGMVFAQRPTAQGGEVITTRVNTPEGEAVKVATKATSGSRGLTPNAQNALLKRYGAVADIVGDLGDPANIDFNQLAIEVGKAERSQDLADLKSKESGLSSAQKKDNAGFIASKKDLISLKAKIQELQEDGREPGIWQNAFASAAANPSTGWFSSIRRQLANAALNEDTIQKESLRAGLESAVVKALSGLAVTSQEAVRLSPLIPQKDDTLAIILQKTASLEDFLNNRIDGGSGATIPTTPATSGTKIGRFTLLND